MDRLSSIWIRSVGSRYESWEISSRNCIRQSKDFVLRYSKYPKWFAVIQRRGIARREKKTALDSLLNLIIKIVFLGNFKIQRNYGWRFEQAENAHSAFELLPLTKFELVYASSFAIIFTAMNEETLLRNHPILKNKKNTTEAAWVDLLRQEIGQVRQRYLVDRPF